MAPLKLADITTRQEVKYQTILFKLSRTGQGTMKFLQVEHSQKFLKKTPCCDGVAITYYFYQKIDFLIILIASIIICSNYKVQNMYAI